MTELLVHGRRGRVGVFGLGYVGSAVAEGFAAVADVLALDPARTGSASVDEVADADVVFVCVPTPGGADGAADLSVVRSVLGELAGRRTHAVVVLKCTVPPGATDALAEAHPTLALCVVPEFLRERHAVVDFARPHRIALGWTSGMPEPSRALVRRLFRCRFPSAPLVELAATQAELLKYASNAFFAVKVSFANEMAELAGELGVAWDPVRAALVLDPRVRRPPRRPGARRRARLRRELPAEGRGGAAAGGGGRGGRAGGGGERAGGESGAAVGVVSGPGPTSVSRSGISRVSGVWEEERGDVEGHEPTRSGS